jgi:hypothetical protein
MMLLDSEATKGLNLKTEWLHEYTRPNQPSWPVVFGIDYASSGQVEGQGARLFRPGCFRAHPGGRLVLVDGHRRHLSKGEALNLVVTYGGVPDAAESRGGSIGKGEEFYTVPGHDGGRGRAGAAAVGSRRTGPARASGLRNGWLPLPGKPYLDCRRYTRFDQQKRMVDVAE